ncbi:uncharacterized protein hdly isoform X2 [Palaemon carinicauda]
MFSKRMISGVASFMLIGTLVSPTNGNPVMTMESDTELNTEVLSTETSRERNPIYNVWEYAYIHDGSIGTRNAAAAQTQAHNQGNQCLWAIVSCCSAHTNYERDNCFDVLGCSGAWFQNLCSPEYINVANNRISSIFSGGFGKK